MARVSLLHSNDLHGNLTPGRLAFLKVQRERSDLYFDSGDVIKAGNLAVPLSADAAWSRLAEARCTASTLGNRETHVLAGAFSRKVAGAAHPLLVANLFRRDGSLVFPACRVFEVGTVRVGVVGVMVPMVTKAMKSQAASQYLWEPPILCAQQVARDLRPEVDLLIALTHIGITQDRRLAEAVPEIDLILGGHSHTVIEIPETVGRVRIAQGGSHGRFLGRYEWEVGLGLVEADLIPWID